MARILIPIAHGSEELEAVTLIDLLRRADFQVVVAGLEPGPVTCSRGVVIKPDVLLDEVLDDPFDLVVLPGGLPGANRFDADPRMHALLRRMQYEGRFIGAICAAPKVLGSAGLLKGRTATGHPSVVNALDLPETRFTGQAVEVDGNIATSQGPGTAMDFALALIELLAGTDKRREVEGPLCRP
ncbi:MULTISPECIES: DJ-1 family glyoxalase III [unclassified Ectothiorhodospira]|uniref:DJ-1 family glyoxalase III n=1 Tax=unclassified Ectothiorhodospira TaxID=2684909 RepID=UPI001EE89F91|nr:MULTISPECIES: DJ-1 family glyoxalase III [unclassified Ectothiorhodospira]MCG5514694.1 DJ-1/PfpI family protein [Ectothiorhodospira sp. 9100]MCG5518293.1 DJ-1/PfpI family protein [Ectothiorhodospira sp. 9905]